MSTKKMFLILRYLPGMMLGSREIHKAMGNKQIRSQLKKVWKNHQNVTTIVNGGKEVEQWNGETVKRNTFPPARNDRSKGGSFKPAAEVVVGGEVGFGGDDVKCVRRCTSRPRP